jgi:16S rRNA (cytosine967-C5)-methyltransferase
MTPAGRLAAAIEVLAEVLERHRPVRAALKAWGEASRFAGSKDRAFVSGLVLDGLRRRRSLEWAMGAEGPRAIALAALRFAWDWSADQVAEAAAGQPHGPGALSPEEAAALAAPRPLEEAPPAVRGDYPDWLDEPLARVFGEGRGEEAAALAHRAPVDLRVNTLKSDAERALKALQPFGTEASGVLVNALRIPAPQAAERAAAVEAEPVFAKGWFEVQDLGSQIAAAAAGPVAGKQVLDLCAGGGGKSMALAAAMGNTGQLWAYDADARRLSEVVRRGQRAGVRNLQVRSPSDPDPLYGLQGRMDVVFVDAPCTGSGVWRRHPDAKWRLTPAQLERRRAEQADVLALARPLLKPGGRLIYVTCSLLAEEDEDQVAAFLTGAPEFAPASALDGVAASGLATLEGLEALRDRLSPEGFLRLSPATTATDGFFIAVLERAPQV